MATQLLTKLGIGYSVHPYDADAHEGGYGLAASEALGVAPERLFKTLVAEVDDKLTVAVVPVAGSLDLKALAGAAGGKKARMADPAAAERATGYVTGGISPLGQRRRLPVVVDASRDRVRHGVLQRRTARTADRAGPGRPGSRRRGHGSPDRTTLTCLN